MRHTLGVPRIQWTMAIKFIPHYSAIGLRFKRNTLGEEFIAALYEDFQRIGRDAIRRVAIERPGEYIRSIASLVIKRPISEPESVFDGISTERLEEIILAVDALIENQ